ncbi:MAG TPA: hypothetical protein VD902_01335 [Symbiobacteriaceae bacterium]|nr:hypothetical protein [Symbiobacteriaceae bacterium]
MSRAWLKYAEVARITVRSRWAYLGEQLISNWFLVVVIFVFVQLWKVTYASQAQQMQGFTLAEMIWYLVATESIILSLPRIHSAIEQEVKSGDLALRLNKPYNYLLFHFSAFIGEGLVRLMTCLLIAGLTAYVMVGGFIFRWEAAPVLLAIYLTTAAMHFFYNAMAGVAAFWLEDVMGLFFVLDKLKWLLGGLLLPVELFPGVARTVAEALPFRYMIAGPARLFVKFSWDGAWQLFQSQLLWTVVFGAICVGVYRLGVRRVDVNGG